MKQRGFPPFLVIVLFGAFILEAQHYNIELPMLLSRENFLRIGVRYNMCSWQSYCEYFTLCFASNKPQLFMGSGIRTHTLPNGHHCSYGLVLRYQCRGINGIDRGINGIDLDLTEITDPCALPNSQNILSPKERWNASIIFYYWQFSKFQLLDFRGRWKSGKMRFFRCCLVGAVIQL